MTAASVNRIAVGADRVRARLEEVGPEAASLVDENAALDFDTHFMFQDAQARAHAGGKLSLDEAQTIYVALGEAYSDANGGWASGTDTATKVAVTIAMAELLLT